MKKMLSKLKGPKQESTASHSELEHSPVAAQPKPHKSSLLATIAILILAPIMALILTAFVFRSYQVDGSSMTSTLQPNDRLIIDKIPKTWSKITGHTYFPERGDIIVFTKHGLDQYDPGSKERELIKRVIALPGERVVVKDRKLVVYNNQYPKGFEPDKTMEYGSVIDGTPGNIDVTIPEGELFVCGDNRFDSLDSRIFGPIPAKDVIGKLTFRLFPLGEAKKF